MKKKIPIKSNIIKSASAASKPMRIISDAGKVSAKKDANVASNEVTKQYATVMSYYYNAEASEIEGMVNALKAARKKGPQK